MLLTSELQLFFLHKNITLSFSLYDCKVLELIKCKTIPCDSHSLRGT